MKPTTFIKTTLGDLINVLDARSTICIYGYDAKTDKETLLRNMYYVYEIYTWNYFEKIKDASVIGLRTGLNTTTILIEW